MPSFGAAVRASAGPTPASTVTGWSSRLGRGVRNGTDSSERRDCGSAAAKARGGAGAFEAMLEVKRSRPRATDAAPADGRHSPVISHQ